MGQGQSALHQAALQGNVQAVRVAVQERPTQIDDTEPTHGWTALHIAAAKVLELQHSSRISWLRWMHTSAPDCSLLCMPLPDSCTQVVLL
jgi:hypothetical protein